MILFLLLFAALLAVLIADDRRIVTTRYNVDAGLGTPVTVVQISDLHGRIFGTDNARLLKAVRHCTPDLIAVTGDLVSGTQKHFGDVVALARDLTAMAPVFFVPGNHECKNKRYTALERELRAVGVSVLANTAESITIRGCTLRIVGVMDSFFYHEESAFTARLREVTEDAAGKSPRILLSHHPDYLDLYSRLNYDLVLSGHVHGGQIRLPGIGPLYAPGQGFLPTYGGGRYKKGHTTMVVSRGLGGTSFPIRINNPPEIPVIRLR